MTIMMFNQDNVEIWSLQDLDLQYMPIIFQNYIICKNQKAILTIIMVKSRQ